MGTKRFLVTEEEKKNILSQYNYKGLLNNIMISEGRAEKVKELISKCYDNPGTPTMSDNALKLIAKDFSDNVIDEEGNETNYFRSIIYKTKNKANFCRMVKIYNETFAEDDFFEDIDWEYNLDSDWKQIQEPISAIMKQEAPKKQIQKEQGCPNTEKSYTDKGWTKIPENEYKELATKSNVERKYFYCKNTNKNVYFKKYKSEPEVGGGGMPIGSTNTNMKDDDNTHWITLYKKLRELGLTPNTGGLSPTDTPSFTINKFTFNRNSKPFVSYDIDGTNKIEGNILDFDNITPKRYSGEELNMLNLILTNDPKNRGQITLSDFLGVNKSKKIIDYTQKKPIKTIPSKTTYTPCPQNGPYIKGCKSETIKKVQGCLGLSADGKMGSNTVNVIKSKLGRTYFTDADVNTLCSNKSKIDTKGQDELDNVEYDVDTKKEEPTPNQSQTTFGGEEF